MKALYSTKPSAGSALPFYFSFIVKTDGILDKKIVLLSVKNANKVFSFFFKKGNTLHFRSHINWIIL